MSGGNFKVFVGIHAIDHCSKHLTHISSLASQAGKNVGVINNQLKLMSGVAAMAIGGAATGAMLGFIKHTVVAGEELERMKLKLEGVGRISAAQRKGILGDVKMLTNMPYLLTQSEGIKTAIDLHTVLGDVGHARAALPQAMKLHSALGIYMPNLGTEQVYDAYRGAELSSAQGDKPATMSAIMGKVDALTKIVVGTGGKVDYTQLHSFMRMNKNLRTTMSNEGIYGMARIIQEMGGSQAGTALQALGRAGIQGKFGSSTQGKAYIAQWARMGLLDSVMLNGQTRIGKGINPDAIEARGSKVRDVRIKDLALLMADPAKWGATTFTSSLAARGVNVNDNASVMKAIGPMTGNQNLAQILSMLVTQRGAISKDRDIVRASADSGKLYNMAINSYPGQKQLFGKNIEKLNEAVGATLVPLALQLLKVVNPLIQQITSFVKQHPSITRFVVALGLIGGVMTVIGGIALTIAGFIGILGTGLGALGIPLGTLTGAGGLIALLGTGLTVLGAAFLACWDKVKEFWHNMRAMADNFLTGMIGNLGSDATNPNTPDKMAARAAAYQKSNAEKIAGQNASLRGLHSGERKLSNAGGTQIHFNINGVTDPKEVARAVEAKLASVGKNLNVPTSGYGYYQSPGFMSA